MRNFLRADQSKVLGHPAIRRWLQPSLMVSAGLLVATLFVAQLVSATGQTCTNADNADIFTPGVGNTSTWQDTNFYYKVFVFYAHDTGTANSGATCGVSMHVNTADPQFMVNGVRPVDARLGVPNMNVSNNNGLYAAGQSVGTKHDLVTQPPQFHSNFHSYGAYDDDGGMATIASDNRHQTFQTLWCQNFNPDAPGAGGVGPGSLLPGDHGKGCPEFPAPNSPDITSYGYAANGTGFMFTADNCHFGIDGQPATDTDGFQAAPCQSQTSQTRQNMWYWNPMQALPDVTAVTDPNNPKGNLSLKNFIGCNGTGSLCDGRNDLLDSFTVHEYSRNHLYNFPNQTCPELIAANLEACATSSQTVMTFAYPVPATLNVSKTPSGCSLLENTNLGPNSCSSASAEGSYVITLKESTPSGFKRPLLTNVTLTDTVPVYAVAIHTNANGTVVNQACPSQDQGSISGASGQTVTWNLSSAENQTLSNGGVVYRCYNVNTKTLTQPSPEAFTNVVVARGTVATTNLPATPDSASTTNYIYRPEQPYLTTSQGDVHTGGKIVGFSISCNNSVGALQGQTAGGSSGTYVVSAGAALPVGRSSVTAFPSLNGLMANVYQGVCRPDLTKGVANFKGTIMDPGTTISGTYTAPDGKGLLLMPQKGLDVTLNGPVTIKGRVTLLVRGNLKINGPTPIILNSLSGGSSDIASQLGSFGVVVTGGDINIASGVQNMVGYYYDQTGSINTCTDSNGAPISSTAQLLSTCRNILTLNGLMSADKFDFNRVGDVSQTGIQPSEVLNFNGLLFVAPPPLFDGNINASSGTLGPEIEPPQF